MVLPISGTIKISDIKNEFGGTSNSLSSYYRGGQYVLDTPLNASIPTSGTIKLSDFYGKQKLQPSKIVYLGALQTGNTFFTANTPEDPYRTIILARSKFSFADDSPALSTPKINGNNCLVVVHGESNSGNDEQTAQISIIRVPTGNQFKLEFTNSSENYNGDILNCAYVMYGKIDVANCAVFTGTNLVSKQTPSVMIGSWVTKNATMTVTNLTSMSAVVSERYIGFAVNTGANTNMNYVKSGGTNIIDIKAAWTFDW